MPDQLQLRGGTTAEHSTFTGAIKEVTVDTTKKTAVVHDGTTAGGVPLLRQDGSNSALALGSEGTPSLKWDANTGIFSPGEDQLAVATNGTRAITITSTQAVGIKTPNPSTALHVNGNARVGADDVTDAFLQIGKGATGNRNSYIDIVGDTTYTDYGVRFIRNNTGANATSEIKHRGTGAFNIITQEAAPIGFYTSNSPRVAIDTSGRLLVGASTGFSAGSNSQFGKFQMVGNTFSASGHGILSIGRGETASSITSNEEIGIIPFTDNDGNTFAQIVCAADADAGAVSDFPGRLVFSTTADGGNSPTPRMTITSGGRISTFATNIDAHVTATSDGAGTAIALYVGKHSSTGIGTGTDCYIVFNNGNVVNTNNSYLGISDIKLKENIVDASSQWNDIKDLQVRNYNFKEETGHQTHTQIGLVAQEVELVSPGLVTESPDRDAEGNDLGTVTKNVNYSVLYMKAVKALQEAMERIEQLETSNIDLLTRVTALETA